MGWYCPSPALRSPGAPSPRNPSHTTNCKTAHRRCRGRDNVKIRQQASQEKTCGHNACKIKCVRGRELHHRDIQDRLHSMAQTLASPFAFGGTERRVLLARGDPPPTHEDACPSSLHPIPHRKHTCADSWAQRLSLGRAVSLCSWGLLSGSPGLADCELLTEAIAVLAVEPSLDSQSNSVVTSRFTSNRCEVWHCTRVVHGL